MSDRRFLLVLVAVLVGAVAAVAALLCAGYGAVVPPTYTRTDGEGTVLQDAVDFGRVLRGTAVVGVAVAIACFGTAAVLVAAHVRQERRAQL